MFVAIGYILCLGCIFGAYIIHGGNMSVIIHAMPTEMMASVAAPSAPSW